MKLYSNWLIPKNVLHVTQTYTRELTKEELFSAELKKLFVDSVYMHPDKPKNTIFIISKVKNNTCNV